jgi:hypothetical protein
MTRGTAPRPKRPTAATPGYPSANPGLRSATDHPGGRRPCVPTRLPARNRRTLLPRSPTAPPCAAQTEFSATRSDRCTFPPGWFTAHAEMRALRARIFMRCLVCRYPNRAIVKSSLSIMSEAHRTAESARLNIASLATVEARITTGSDSNAPV